MPKTTSQKNLANALKVNAVVSLSSALVLMIFPKWIAEILYAKAVNVLGLTGVDIVQITGFVLLLFAGLIIFSLGQRKHFKTLAAIITSQDVIWVFSCIGIAVYSTSLFSTNGLIIFLSQTFIIAAIAYCQFTNLNLSKKETKTI